MAPRPTVWTFVARRVYLPAVAIAAVGMVLAGRGFAAMGGSAGANRAITAARLELIGPLVLAFVAVIFLMERRWPAQPRPALARGHVHDALYLLVYVVVVVPLIVLIGAGFTATVVAVAPGLVVAHLGGPAWLFVVIALVAMDGLNWLAHLANHRIDAFFRLHAVHHAQEELSILTTFRAHPFVHVSFLVSTLPVVVLAHNGVVPTVAISLYICLASLPHANTPWTFGPFGRVVVSPAYHRVHHRVEGRLDVNMGSVLTVWDVLAGRAVFPACNGGATETGLADRPVPVEQAGPRPHLLRTLGAQLAEPFGPVNRGRRDAVPEVDVGSI
jgi:sterol desaturase/sphingolipid hydroxylase (fatty acid hydroxylase superfamily)